MPNSTSNSTPSSEILTGTPAASSAKAKRPKAPRKASPARSSRVAKSPTSAPAVTPGDILFTLPPDPTKTPIPPYIWIDYPQEAERLLGPVYHVRMGIGGAEKVEMSIDGGPWLNCRLTSGYWWFDWSGIQPGRHVLVARMRTENGRWYRTPPRTCEFRP
jgi:hypothetical protein